MPAVAVPLVDEPLDRRPARAPAASRRAASSTPGVVPAMTSRRAPQPRRQVPGERVGVDVEQPAVARRARCTRRPARSRRRSASSAAACRRRRSGCRRARDRPCRPSTVRCGGAGSTSPHAASAPVSPTAAHAGGVQRRDEPGVDRAGQHRDHDVERRLVGDAQARRPGASRCRRPSARRRFPCRRRGR